MASVISYYLLPITHYLTYSGRQYLTERSIRVNPINPCSKKKLSGETNTDYKDITDFLTEEPVKVNGHAPEKSADLIDFIHFYVLLGDE